MLEKTAISILIKLSNNMKDSVLQNIERVRSFVALNFPELETKLTDPESFIDFVDKSNCNFNIEIDGYPGLLELFKTTVGHPLSLEDQELLSLIVKEIKASKAEKAKIDEEVAKHIKKDLTALVTLLGEPFTLKLLGEHSSLKKLAFLPSSSIQIMGAERTLQMAIRNKTNTPKFGVIYNAGLLNLVRNKKDKGKLARTLAAKITLCAKLDYWNAPNRKEIAMEYLTKIKNRSRCISQAKKKGGKTGATYNKNKPFDRNKNSR